MLRKLAGLLLAASITAVPSLAQTTAELLQKGIFAQETEGNLDSAIMTFRQIVNSAPSQRDLAAQAQYRLAQALLQKGDLANASVEFNKLARDYADFQKLIGTLASQASKAAGGTTSFFVRTPDGRTIATGPGEGTMGVAGRGGVNTPPGALTALGRLIAMPFNGSTVTVRGKVRNVTWVNPSGLIMVDQEGADGYLLLTAAPNQMLAQGTDRTSIKLGDEVTVTATLSQGSEKLEQRIPGRAETIVTSEGKMVFNRATLPPPLTPEQLAADAEKRAAQLQANAQTSEFLKMQNVELLKKLEALRQQYSETHPDVQKAMKQLEEMRLKMEAAGLAVRLEGAGVGRGGGARGPGGAKQ